MSDMIEIVLATSNKKKIEEIKRIISIPNVKFVSLSAFPDAPEVVEDGKTFAENAIKKAKEVAKALNMLAIADDSGLEVDALDGKPGVYSARYAREGASDYENNMKLLTELEGVPKHKRAANFRCVIAFASPEDLILTAEATCDGYIADDMRGDMGFGYDPLFTRYEDHKTFAEILPTHKCRISHRAKALEKAAIHIESYFLKR